jgi:hypothetical protein
MKFTILVISLLYTISGIAQMKVEIKPNDSKYAKMQLDCTNAQDCDAKILSWIERQKSFVGEWDESSENSISSKVEQDLEGNSITKYYHSNDFIVSKIDISSQLQEQALDAAIENKLKCGESTIKFIGKNNVSKNLTKEQIKTMVTTYSQIFDLLKAGAVETAIDDMQNVVVDNIIVTEQDKSNIISFINGCK